MKKAKIQLILSTGDILFEETVPMVKTVDKIEYIQGVSISEVENATRIKFMPMWEQFRVNDERYRGANFVCCGKEDKYDIKVDLLTSYVSAHARVTESDIKFMTITLEA